MYVKKSEIAKFINKTIHLPENCTALRIDVGLAGEAPNAAKWLLETKDRFVIGIEPIDHHWDMLTQFETADTDRPYPDFPFIQLGTDSIEHDREEIGKIRGRFLGIQCAIDDVENLTFQSFYQMDRSMGASGSSSLLKPTSKHPHFVEKKITTPTISLSRIIDLLDYSEPIEHIKTDCEAHDFSVVKSLNHHLERVCFISSEMSIANKPHHFGAYDHKEFLEFMFDHGFRVIKKRYGIFNVNAGEIHFMNKRLRTHIKSKGFKSTTFGL